METNVLKHISYEASPQITQTDCEVLKLWLAKAHLASMKISPAKLRLNVQARKECDHAKNVIREKIIIY